VPQYLGRSNSAVRLAVENALNDYQAGDFATADEAWKEAVSVAEEIAAR
jgi:ribosomal protein S20